MATTQHAHLTLNDDYHRAGCTCKEAGCHAANQAQHTNVHGPSGYDPECCVCNGLYAGMGNRTETRTGGEFMPQCANQQPNGYYFCRKKEGHGGPHKFWTTGGGSIRGGRAHGRQKVVVEWQTEPSMDGAE